MGLSIITEFFEVDMGARLESLHQQGLFPERPRLSQYHDKAAMAGLFTQWSMQIKCRQH